MGLLWLCVCIGIGHAQTQAEKAQDVSPFHSAQEVVSTEYWDLRNPRQLALEGVVTWADGPGGYIILQDSSGPVAFQIPPFSASVKAGDRVALSASAVAPRIPALPRFPYNPTGHEQLQTFEGPSNSHAHYFDRVRGYVTPPETGEYIFWVSSDDSAELWLSPTEAGSEAKLIAYNFSWTDPKEWSRFPSQHSAPFWLQAGKRYYIETLHAQNGGPDNLAVAWQGPNLSKQIISEKYLQPWSDPSTPPAGPHGLLREYWYDSGAKYIFVLDEQRSQSTVYTLKEPRISVVASGNTRPKPSVLRIGEKLPKALDHSWAEVVGTVTYLARTGNGLNLELSDGDSTLEVNIQEWRGEDQPQLLNSTVRVTGVCEGRSDLRGDFVAGSMLVSTADTIPVVAPAKDWAKIEPVYISDLGSSKYSGAEGRLVRIRGRVVSQDPGNSILLRDEGYFEAYASPDGQQWKQIGAPINLPMTDPVYVGLAVASHSYEDLAVATFDHVNGLSMPAKDIEIGESILPGNFSHENEQFVVTGNGGEIWDSSDQFHFVYRSMKGDGEIIARVASVHSPTPYTKAGVMIRQSLKSQSPFVDVISLGGTGPSLQWRGATLGSRASSAAADTALPIPYWVKLVRRHAVIRLATQQDKLVPAGSLIEAVGYLDSLKTGPTIRDAFYREVPDEQIRGHEEEGDRPLLTTKSILEKESAQLPDASRLEGVVTFSGTVEQTYYLAVQDSSGGMLVSVPDDRGFVRPAPGDFVSIESDPLYGETENRFHADKIIPRGRGTMPKPLLHPTEYLLPKKGEGQWVEIDGVVYAVNRNDVALIKNKSGFFSAWVDGMTANDWSAKVDSIVRLRGVAAYPSGNQQVILVPSVANLELVERPVDDVSTLPMRGIAELISSEVGSRPSHRVKIGGVVTYRSKAFIVAQDATAGAKIQTNGNPEVAVGDRIEVIGFPETAGNALELVEARVRRTGTGTPPPPLTTKIDELIDRKPSGMLVRLEAKVLGSSARDGGQSLELQSEQRTFNAFIETGESTLPSLPEGSIVAVMGVYMPDGDLAEWFGRSNRTSPIAPFKLLLRSGDDVTVLRLPSWWRLKRALMVIGGLVLGLCVSFVWVHVLRRRVRERTRELEAATKKLKEETQISATLAERNRLAGEIHDSLEQGFSGLLLQLDATAKLPGVTGEIKDGLGLAKNMVSFSRDEVHHAVWNLQSPVLEESDLGTALRRIAQQTSLASLAIDLAIDGPARPLSPVIEHHLLRIGQEAMTNAVKHASPKTINVRLVYRPDAVTLTIRDDGVGFSTKQVLAGRLGHFGLRSLRSRAKKINAQLNIASEAGRGSTVEVSVPLETGIRENL